MTMPRYKLRTLLILLAVLAVGWNLFCSHPTVLIFLACALIVGIAMLEIAAARST